MVDYNEAQDIYNVLLEMRKRFGFEIFRNATRMYSVICDLSPERRRDANVLKQMCSVGLMGDFEKAIYSDTNSVNRISLKAQNWLVDELFLPSDRAQMYSSVVKEIFLWTEGSPAHVFDEQYHLRDESNIAIKPTEENLAKSHSNIMTKQISISAGVDRFVARRADGTVITTPYRGPANSNVGQFDVSSWKNIVSVSAGGYHTVGLMSDGRVIATKIKENEKKRNLGQCLVAEWSNVKAISAGGTFTVGLKSDHTVSIAGRSGCDVSNWENIVSIAAGGRNIYGLTDNGTVLASGDNSYNQCNVSAWRDIISICKPVGRFILGLRSDGIVVATGENNWGQCEVSSWRDIVAISAGAYHSVGLRSDGTVVATGVTTQGHCDVSEWVDIVAVSAGMLNTVGIRSDGSAISTKYSGPSRYDLGQCEVSDWRLF